MSKVAPPKWLKKGGLEQWKMRAKEYFSLQGDPSIAGVERFARYCDLLAKWDKARLFIDDHGYVFPVYEPRMPGDDPEAKRVIKHMTQFPQVAIYRQLGESISRMERELELLGD